MNALIIKATGKMLVISPANGRDFKLNEMQAIVGGYVEVLPLPNSKLMLVNEEGKRENLPVNVKASMIYRGDWIVGDVLICDSGMVK